MAIAVAINTTVADAAAARLGRHGDGAAVDEVLVRAAPDADTTSVATGPASGSTITLGAAVAITVAVDTTLATSMSTSTRARSTSYAVSADGSNAHAIAGAGGSAPAQCNGLPAAGAPTAGAQTEGWLDGIRPALPSDPAGDRVTSLLPPGESVVPTDAGLADPGRARCRRPARSRSPAACSSRASPRSRSSTHAGATPYGPGRRRRRDRAQHRRLDDDLAASSPGIIEVTDLDQLTVLAEAEPDITSTADASALDTVDGVAAAVAINVAVTGHPRGRRRAWASTSPPTKLNGQVEDQGQRRLRPCS